MLDDLNIIRDDMKAFIEGHGLLRYPGYVNDELPSIMWDAGDNVQEGWKDFVELAQASGVKFLTVNTVDLDKDELDYLVERLRNSAFPNDEDLDDARWLRSFTGKCGFVQLGFAYHGSMFIYEISTEWYDRYQRLVDSAEEFGGIVLDEPDQDDER